MFANNSPEESHHTDRNNSSRNNTASIECTDTLYNSGNLALGAHYQLHEYSEANYECPQCFRTYRRHGTLRRHLRQECGKGKSMVCSVCGHRTKRADHLRQHVRKKHPEMAIRSYFRRPNSAGGNNHGVVRTHGFAHHRLSPQQQQQRGDSGDGGMQLLPYADARARPQESPDSTKARAYNTTAASMAASASVGFMGVDVVDLDAEDDRDIVDDDDKSVSDKYDNDNGDEINNDNGRNLRAASDTNLVGDSDLGIDIAYRQHLQSQQALYQFRHQFQHQRQQQQVDAFKSKNVD